MSASSHPLRRIAQAATALAGLLLLTLVSPVSATPANVLGTATGTFSADLLGCTDSADNGPNSGSMTVIFNDQLDSSFAGVVSGSDRFGAFNGTISGSVTDNLLSYSISIVGDGGATESSLSGSGTLTGTTLTLMFSGSDIIGDTCSILNGMATLVYQGNIISSNSAPSDALLLDQAFTALRTNASIFASRFDTVRRGKLGLASIDSGVMLSGEIGASAGAGWSRPLGVWGSFVRTDSENDFASTRADSNNNTFFVGADFEPWENTLVGLAVGFEAGSSSTKFNNGDQDSQGWTVAPYFGWFISDLVSFDASGGITSVNIDQSRSVGATTITSEVDAVRYFASANVNLTHQYQSLLLTGTGGMLWASQKNDEFTESNGTRVAENSADVGQFRFGGEVAYLAGNFEPFVGGLYSLDFTRTRQIFAAGTPAPKSDNDDFQVNVGVRYFGDDGLSGSLEYSRLLGRENYDEGSFTANVRWNF